LYTVRVKGGSNPASITSTSFIVVVVEVVWPPALAFPRLKFLSLFLVTFRSSPPTKLFIFAKAGDVLRRIAEAIAVLSSLVPSSMDALLCDR